MGREPTGRTISVGLVVVLRIAEDKVVEEWQLSDGPALAKQLTDSE